MAKDKMLMIQFNQCASAAIFGAGQLQLFSNFSPPLSLSFYPQVKVNHTHEFACFCIGPSPPCVFRQWRDSAASGTYHFPTQFSIKKSFKGIDQTPPICIYPPGLSQLQALSQESAETQMSVIVFVVLWVYASVTSHIVLEYEIFSAPVKAKRKK